MKRISFYVFYAFAWLVSLMPFWLLHGFADFIFVLLYYVFGYRKEVTRVNLRNAFPEKDEKWIRKTSLRFYKSLADIILEDIKVLTIRQKKLAKHYRYENLEVMEKFLNNGQSVLLACGHCANWEWMGNTLAPQYQQFNAMAIVKALHNPYFDNFMNGLRNRYLDDTTIYMKDTLRAMIKRKDIVSIYALAADQTPSNPKTSYWATFMHQDTAFYYGLDKLARSFDMPVIFIDLYREKRGYYVGEMSLIAAEPKKLDEHQVLDIYINKLEEALRKRPHNWLWSHRRWKHKRIPTEESID